MDTDSVVALLRMIPGNRKIKVSGDGYVHTQCFLAAYSDDHQHNVDKKPSMWINTGGVSFCDCYTCKIGMPFVEVLEHYNRLSNGQISHAVAEAHKLEKEYRPERSYQVYRPTDVTSNYENNYLQDPEALPLDFLASKGVRESGTISAFRIGVDAKSGVVTFPIILRNNRVVGAQGRSVMEVDDRRGKYFSLYPGCRKSAHLFGEHLLQLKLRQNPDGSFEYLFLGRAIVVVEGPLDCMHAYEVGLRNVVAIMGSKISPEQAKLLSLLAGKRPIAMLLDPDAPGRKGSISSINEIFTEYAPEAAVRLYCPPCDPKEMSLDDFKTVLTGEAAWQKKTLKDLLSNL